MSIKTDDAIKRFSENEERVNTFVNSEQDYTTNTVPPKQVKSIRGFIADMISRYLTYRVRDNWATATAYLVQDIAIQSGIAYICLNDHTSGVFADDLAANKWAVYQGATKNELAAYALNKGSWLIGFLFDAAGAVGRTLQAVLSDKVSVKNWGAIGDGVTDDTAAITAADSWCATNGKTLWFPDGVYICGRLAFSDASRYWLSSGATIKTKNGIYTGNIAPMFSGSFVGKKVIFDGIRFDQDWTNTTYPAGFSRNDAYKASSWGGGSWLGVLEGNQTSTIEFRNCYVDNVFRGFLVKSQKNFRVVNCQSDASNSIGDSVFAAELCISVKYTGNELVARNWKENPGYTGANGLFGNTCKNVQISNNQMRGFQLVFHATEPGASDVGMGRRLLSMGNIIEYPPADTAFYRWDQCNVFGNEIYYSGDMGIAISGSSFAVVNGNVIKGCHIGGIGVEGCQGVTITGNSITDVAQDYAEIQTLAGRYAGNAGAWISGITCDYQSGGQKGVECTISGNTLGFTTLPPVSDSLGQVRSKVNGIQIQTTPNAASQSTFAITGNYVHSDKTNLPNFFISAPSHRFYTASVSGTPKPGEVFTSGGNSFVYIADYGAGSLCFVKKLIGTVGTAVVFTGSESGATIVSANPAPQLLWLGMPMAGNFDFTTTYENAHL